MFESKTPPIDSRKNFERNAFLLAEGLNAGKILFNEELRHSFNGLTRVRILPNGRINLHTIDEMTRCLMNSLKAMTSHEFKKENNE